MIIDRPVCVRACSKTEKNTNLFCFRSAFLAAIRVGVLAFARTQCARPPRSKTTAEILCIQNKFVSPNSPLNRVFFYALCVLCVGILVILVIGRD